MLLQVKKFIQINAGAQLKSGSTIAHHARYKSITDLGSVYLLPSDQKNMTDTQSSLFFTVQFIQSQTKRTIFLVQGTTHHSTTALMPLTCCHLVDNLMLYASQPQKVGVKKNLKL